MSTGANEDVNGEAANWPAWADCDLFCIHHYAGSGAKPCGWRGRVQDARHDAQGGKLVCPHCGLATLLRIPLDRADRPGQ